MIWETYHPKVFNPITLDLTYRPRIIRHFSLNPRLKLALGSYNNITPGEVGSKSGGKLGGPAHLLGQGVV